MGLGENLRRMRVKAVSADAYNELHAPIRTGGGREGRHAVGAHALGGPQVGGQLLPLLDLGRRLVRPQILAGTLGRPEHGIADPELVRGFLGALSAAAGVGEVRYPVGAYAPGGVDR